MLYWDQPGAEGTAGVMLASSRDVRAWEKDPVGAGFMYMFDFAAD